MHLDIRSRTPPFTLKKVLLMMGYQNDYPNGSFWVLFQREEWD